MTYLAQRARRPLQSGEPRRGHGERGAAVGTLLVALSLCLILLPAPLSGGRALADTAYTVVDLGTLGGGASFATAINDAGQVAGYARTAGGASHAFRTAPNSPINPATDDLGTLPGGSESFAAAINDAGQVVGQGDIPSSPETPMWHAFLYDDAGMHDLGTLDGNCGVGTSSAAAGINAAGQVVGTSGSCAFLVAGTPPASLQDLGSLGGNGAAATAINIAGQVAGFALTSTGAYHAFRTDTTGLITPTDDLGTLGGTNSFAQALNDAGTVVGVADTADSLSHAFLADEGGMHDLGSLGGLSEASGINASGQVVGYSCTAPGEQSCAGTVDQHAFLVDSGTMEDLNTLIPAGSGWVLNTASAINSRGEIVGTGTINGQVHGYLLTPPAAVSLTPSGVDFGTQTPGLSSPPQSVVLTNSGSGPLTVGSLVLGGSNPSDFGETDTCSGTILAPGGTCTITVTFTPTVSGLRTATVQLADNAGDSPQTLPLTGTGTPPPTLDVSPASATVATPLIATGANFAPGEPIAVYWDSVDSAPLVTTTADDDGTFGADIPVPAATVGPHALIAVGQTSDLSVTATVTVAPRITVGWLANWSASRPTGTLPTTIFYGTGFGAGESVGLAQLEWWWWTPLPCVGTSDAHGSVAIVCSAPALASSAWHSVLALGARTRATAVLWYYGQNKASTKT